MERQLHTNLHRQGTPVCVCVSVCVCVCVCPHHTMQGVGANLRPDPSLSDVRRSSELRYHLQQTNSRTQRSHYNLANARVSAIMKQLSSDVGDLRKTSSVCPFCNKTFKILGEHPQYCKERKGRPYADFLAASCGSQSKATKPMASPPVPVDDPIVISRKICTITGHTNLVWFHQVQRNHGESHTTGLSRK